MAIITISRGTFSGGQTLAECLSKKLGYRIVSREILAQAARDHGVEEEELENALHGKPGILERMSSERIHYLAYIRAALLNEIKDDKVVYHGNAGHLLLKDVPYVLKIRVVAGIEYRIGSVMNQKDLDREEAIEYIKKIDKERDAWTKFLYHVDWRDPALYDITINLDRMKVDSACHLLCDAASHDEFRAPQEWGKILEDLIQGAQVRAAIAMNKETGKLDRDLEVEANSGVIKIKGEVPSWKDAERIEEFVRKIPGVNDVLLEGLLLTRY